MDGGGAEHTKMGFVGLRVGQRTGEGRKGVWGKTVSADFSKGARRSHPAQLICGEKTKKKRPKSKG